MLQKSDSLSFNQLIDHVAQHCSNSVEAFIGVADIGQASLIQEDLLNDEDGDSFRQFGSGLHDAKAEGYYFSGQQEVNNGAVIVLLKAFVVSVAVHHVKVRCEYLYKRPDDAK